MKRYALLFALFLGLVAGTRLPIMPGQLFSFDEVNMVYAMDKLDTRLSQPQPPGYPLFILEMHAMKLFRIVRPESNLIALSILGSAAAMLALVWCGDRMFGGLTGLWGAMLLWLYPSFWYAGLNSALRIQLAIISAVVATTCWRAWHGEGRWLTCSSLALGLGAGIRPEIGPLLVPLWLGGLARPGTTWKARGLAVVALLAAILSWLVPLTAGSGGFIPFFRHCWAYLAVQSATTSTLFGLDPTLWLTNSILLVVWTFSALALLPMLWILARGAEDRLGTRRSVFFAVWLLPSLLFACFVHVGDAGHTLAMVAPFCLLLGHQVTRAASLAPAWRRPDWNWLLPALLLALPDDGPNTSRLLLLAASLALALAARWRVSPRPDNEATGNRTTLTSTNAACLILLPFLVFFAHTFLAGGWHYAARPDLTPDRLLSDIRYGFHLSSNQHVRQIVDPDDAAIRATQQAMSGAPGETIILSERSLTSWRKISYYFPRTRLIVLEKLPVRPPQSVATEWQRSVEKRRQQNAPPLHITLPARARLIWMVKPRSDFEAALRQNLPLTSQGSVWYSDLPAEAGTRQVGDYILSWEPAQKP